jgi:hypothetical protein
VKKDDPERLKARANREKAHEWLEILCHGIADQLKDAYDAESVRNLIERRINGSLILAVEASEAADKAYEPFRAYRRIRSSRVVKNRPNPGASRRTPEGRPQKTATKPKRGVAKT